MNREIRAQIVTVMPANRARGVLGGAVEEVLEVGERVVVAFRLVNADPGGWPLDGGMRLVVLSICDGLLTEVKGCASCEVSPDYANAV